MTTQTLEKSQSVQPMADALATTAWAAIQSMAPDRLAESSGTEPFRYPAVILYHEFGGCRLRAMALGTTPVHALSKAFARLMSRPEFRTGRGVWVAEAGSALTPFFDFVDDQAGYGFAIRRGTQLHIVGPSDLVMSRCPPARALEALLDAGDNPGSSTPVETELYRFWAAAAAGAVDEAKISKGVQDFSWFPMVAGMTPPIHRDSRALVQSTVDGMIEWMTNNCSEDGEMVYKYWPSLERPSRGDNTIRQFMATNCLARMATHRGCPELRERFLQNLRRNLDAYYRLEGGLGIVLCQDKVKLGAVAIAARALLEAGDDAPSGCLESLEATLHHLWQDDGSFRTFHQPADRNDCQNYYPGEALWFWAAALHRDERVEERFVRSFRFYRDMHRARRNPAFIPWHSQAYASFLEKRWIQEMADFVFEMNDWLVGIQDLSPPGRFWMRGRFYDPQRPHFGKAHASATGVYMEGLMAAFRLAKRMGDEERKRRYLNAVIRGTFNLRCLQFKNLGEAFYLKEPNTVMGGVRTDTYDNEIRVDNVQHGLMALLEATQVFEAQDFEGAQP